MPDTPPITAQITWVYTNDLAATGRFYADTLGLECTRNEGTACLYRTGQASYIGVCEAFDDRVVEPKGGMITLVTDDVDGWYETLKTRGAPLTGKPHRLDQFGIYTFFLKDPNGYVIEVQAFDTP